MTAAELIRRPALPLPTARAPQASSLRRLLLAGFLALAGCGPTKGEGPIEVMALALDEDRVYRPRQVSLLTLEDPLSLSGTLATPRGGARILEDPNDPLLRSATTPEHYRLALVKNEGLVPRANYITRDGVLWPADFHTWNLVTGYWSLERAQAYFEANGGPAASELGDPVDLFYFPEFTLRSIRSEPLTNNALFFSPIKAMLLLPFDQDLQEAPLAINSGVIAHEWSHRVFNAAVHGGAAFPDVVVRWGAAGANALKLVFALEEGLADFHAVSITCGEPSGCDPDFLETSFDERFTGPRDISRSDHCMSASLRNAIATQALGDFRAQGLDYALGTIIASSLYQAGERAGLREELQAAVLAAYSDTAGASLGLRQLLAQNLDTPENVTLGAVLNTIVSHVSSPALATAVCNEFIDHLKIGREELRACPPSATGGLQCPSIEEGG